MKKGQLLKQAFLFFLCIPFFIWLCLLFLSFSSFAAIDPAENQTKGTVFPTPERKEFYSDNCVRPKETQQNIIQAVGCAVNNLTREFNDDAVDLAVKVPGGRIEVQRRFYRNEWHWDHTRNNLIFKQSSFGVGLESIEKGGVVYKATTIGFNVFTHDTYRITRTGSVYRWKDNYGNWKEYDELGRPTGYGYRGKKLAGYEYADGWSNKVLRVLDKNGIPVLWYEYNSDGRLSAIYDKDNRRVEYDYTDGRLTKVTDVLGNDTFYLYDEQGRITKKTDAAGRDTIVAYSENGSVSSVVDKNGVGHFFEFDYDKTKDERHAVVRTSADRFKEVWYDKDGDTKKVAVNGRTIQQITKTGRDLIIKDEKGNETYKVFDEWDNLKKIMYPDGAVVSFEYDLRFNKVSKTTDPLGNITTYAYDESGNLIQKVDAVGTAVERITNYTYDGENRLTTATIEGDVDTASVTTTFTYDAFGNLASITDPENNLTRFTEYDNMGNLKRMIDPGNHEWTFAYDAAGRLISQTDPLSNTTAYEYNGVNNRTAIVNALLKRFEFEYDDHNNLIRAKDPYQKFIALQYNTDNLPVRITDPEGKTSGSGYDNEGRLIRTADGAGNQTVYHYDMTGNASSHLPDRIEYPTFTRHIEYDLLGRVIQETDDLRNGTTHTRLTEYDAAGRVLSSTDEEGRVTRFEYDALNRPIKTIDPSNNEVTRRYDNRGNLIEVRNPSSGITYYQYDRNNRLVKIIRPMLEETAYEYDAVGNRTAVVDSEGQRIEYTYNEINRLTRVQYYAAGNYTTPVKTVDFTYDALGNIKTYNDGTTSASYSYDDLSRKTSETVNYGSFSLTYAYEYYANGMKKSFTGPDGNTIDYAYDENNRTAGITIPGQGQITYAYDAASWNSPAGKMLPGGSTTAYAYDPRMQLQTLAAKDPGQNPFMTREYQYSPAGSITDKNTEHGNYTYQYDDLYRLTNADNPTVPDEAYTFDLLGNRLSSSATSGPWSYNANNELESINTTDVVYTYDANGNTTNKTNGTNSTGFVYDIEDRMTEVRDGSNALIASYYYDPFGRRLWKEVDGTRTYFLYSDEGLAGEYDASGQEIKTYGWAPDSVWGTDPLFVKTAGTYYWYQNDAAGTPQKIISTSGAVVWSAAYDSFGSCQVEVSGIENNLRFSGQYFDAETGLHYNLNRYYNPKTGRYLQTDPMGDGLNLYAYCFNNPISFIDPMGLCAVDAVGNWLGTGLGEESALWYAQKFNESGAWYYAFGGAFASLWTPDTWIDTTVTLATAGMLSADIRAARSAREAAEFASKRLATNADEAVFWSGIRSGDKAAVKWVSQHGGSTLETTLAKRGIKLPAWDASNPASVAAWRQASKEFTTGASGNVRVLQTDAVRIKSVWAEVEFPALKANQKVTSITAVNPKTGVEILLWSR